MDLPLLNRLPKDWRDLLSPLCDKSDWIKLLEEIQTHETQARVHDANHIAPPAGLVFNALIQTPVSEVKVVILGQDPYHTPGLAQGLAFSIPENIIPGSREFPSSLRNISKALVLDGYPRLAHGDLNRWATQGVLLLNASLTVELGQANAHADWGWQKFTDQLIEQLSARQSGIVWLLWGSFAQKKQDLIAKNRSHLILKASHPSGLSVYKTNEPFIYPGDTQSCRHFSMCNQWLINLKKTPIAW